MAFIYLTGKAAMMPLLEEFGISLGTKLAKNLIMQIPGAILAKINRAVGFRLVAKTGTTGAITLIKFVPFVGGLVGGAFDATVAHGIGAVAKKVFEPIHDDTSTDSAVMPEAPPLVELPCPPS